MARIAIDLSHEQRDWQGYYPSLNVVLQSMPGHTFEAIQAPRSLDASTLASYDALILALPCNIQMSADAISAVRAWITENRKGLFLLSSYTGDTHHRTNLNLLARSLGVLFNEDLVLPHGRMSDQDGHTQVFNRGGDGTFVVRAGVPGGPLGAHPVAQNVRTLGFLSACSLDVSTSAIQFVLPSPPDSAILKPHGERSSRGWITRIMPWVYERDAAVSLFAAFQSDLGKVAASGTWKLLLPELLQTQNVDNFRFVKNVIEWLVS